MIFNYVDNGRKIIQNNIYIFLCILVVSKIIIFWFSNGYRNNQIISQE